MGAMMMGPPGMMMEPPGGGPAQQNQPAMGPMMMGGPGMMMGPGGYDSERYEKAMEETRELRKKMHDMKFEYFEAMRNPKTSREDLHKKQKEMWELRQKIHRKMWGQPKK